MQPAHGLGFLHGPIRNLDQELFMEREYKSVQPGAGIFAASSRRMTVANGVCHDV
jgi:hypothetical protein